MFLHFDEFRASPTKGVESPTFAKENTRINAIEEAIVEIKNSPHISESVKQKALKNLQQQNFTTHTVGYSKVKNSVMQKYCNNKKCN